MSDDTSERAAKRARVDVAQDVQASTANGASEPGASASEISTGEPKHVSEPTTNGHTALKEPEDDLEEDPYGLNDGQGEASSVVPPSGDLYLDTVRLVTASSAVVLC